MRSPRARRASSTAVRALVVRILSGIVPCRVSYHSHRGFCTCPCHPARGSVEYRPLLWEEMLWMASALNDCQARGTTTRWRSEEHTSELQSRSDLVCRLL